ESRGRCCGHVQRRASLMPVYATGEKARKAEAASLRASHKIATAGQPLASGLTANRAAGSSSPAPRHKLPGSPPASAGVSQSLPNGQHAFEEHIMAHSLPTLPYATNALEPFIDTMTMEIHHGRHHKAYVDNLNKALESQAALASKPIEKLLREISQASDSARQAIINNGGGHANHAMFWEIMGPGGGGKPSGPLADDITKTFGDFGQFQAQIKQAGIGRFVSG